MINSIVLEGRLVQNAKRKEFGKTSVTNFSLANNVRVGFDEKANEPIIDTTFVNVTIFNLSEHALKNLIKGRLVIVHGRLQVKQGNDGKYYTNVIGNANNNDLEFIYLASREGSDQQ